jgi:uncharacterized membrane protein YhfC
MSFGYVSAISLNIVLALLLPVSAAVIASKKATRLRVILAGAAVFTLFQLVIRIPLLQVIQYSFPDLVPSGKEINLHYITYSAVLALTAGIFEEFGRYIGIVTVLKKDRNWGDGLGFGIGHGGIEAILLVGVSNVAGLFTNLAAPGQPDWQIAMGGIERLFAMTIQIGLSLLVMVAVYRKKFSLVLLAVALHMVVDFPVGILALKGGILAAEVFVALCAVLSLVWIIKSKKLFMNNVEV